MLGTELVWKVKIAPSGARGSARAYHYRLEGKTMEGIDAQARDARDRATDKGCVDRYRNDSALRNSLDEVRANRSAEQPLLGWDDNYVIDPNIQLHFAKKNKRGCVPMYH